MRRTLLVISLVIALIGITGCSSNNDKAYDSPNRGYIETYYEDIYNQISVFTDPVTKVQYIIWNGSSKGGITPRLDKDGNLYIRE